MHIEGKGR